MTTRIWLNLLLVVAMASVVQAQTTEPENRLLDLPFCLTSINPENAIGIFSLDLPFYFPSSQSTREQISVSYTMANTWHPQAWFYYPQNLSAEQQELNRKLYMTWRPTYFKIINTETKVKTFQSDGVLQHLRFTWVRQWAGKNSLLVNLNGYLLSGGSSPFHYLISDRFIENFHTRFAVNDNYGRRLYPYDRATLQFIDEDGRTYRKEKGDVFSTVIDLHYYHELFRRRTPRNLTQILVGAHLSVPVNRLHPYIMPGLSASFRTDRMAGSKTSVTLAVDGGMTHQNFLKTGTGVKAIDRDWRQVVKFYVGGNFRVSDRTVFQLGLLNNVQGALMNGSRNDWGQVDYPEIGIRFLENGDVWEGEPVSQEFYLAKITPASLYYFSYKAYFVLGWQQKYQQFKVTIGEDFFFINNAPDFQVGFEYLISLSRKK